MTRTRSPLSRTDLTKRLAAVGIDLDVPSADALIEMLKIRIRGGKNSTKCADPKSGKPARFVRRRR